MTKNKTNWKVDTALLDRTTLAAADAITAYNDNANPETRSHKTASIKTVAFNKLKVCMAEVDHSLRANLSVPEGDLIAMGFRPRENHAHEPLPAPEEAPELIVVAGQHHEVTVYASVPLHGHPLDSVRKRSYHGLVFRYLVEGQEEWREKNSTRLKTTLEFAPEDEGKRLTILAAWMNPRLERGPWSDETIVLVN
jgi:hypothetical protein